MSVPLTVTELHGHPRVAEAALVVVVFCAQWCGTCREFRPVLERIARTRPQVVFAWADIEEDAELVGDIDVENFPSLAVFRADQVLHYGVSLPHEAVVARLVNSLLGQTALVASNVPEEVAALAQRVCADAHS